MAPRINWPLLPFWLLASGCAALFVKLLNCQWSIGSWSESHQTSRSNQSAWIQSGGGVVAPGSERFTITSVFVLQGSCFSHRWENRLFLATRILIIRVRLTSTEVKLLLLLGGRYLVKMGLPRVCLRDLRVNPPVVQGQNNELKTFDQVLNT